MRKYRAVRFWQTEDLPLFSGVAPRVKEPGAQHQVSPWKQPALIQVCPRCAGSGRWGKYGYCPCEAGQALRISSQDE